MTRKSHTCFTRTGRPKSVFADRAEAWQSALHEQRRRNNNLEPYRGMT